MAELILNDPIAVRRCILFEFLSVKPVWTCFQYFCYTLGENAIEYQEFEYWFMRFSRKEFELDYDRSKDPPTRNFSDLPLEILQKVLSDMNEKQRRKSALVCKRLHNAVSTLIPPYKDFRVNINNSYTVLFIDDFFYNSFNYYSNGKEFEGLNTEMFLTRPLKWYDNENNHQEVVLKDVYAFLNQPRLELEKLEITQVPDKYWETFIAMLGKLQQKVKTKEIRIGAAERMEELQILPCLDPSFIEKIHLTIDEATKYRMDKLLELEQCRNVKMIEFRLADKEYKNFQVENFMKFRRFALEFSGYCMGAEQLMSIVKALLTSTSLEFVHLDCFFPKIAGPVKLELEKITEQMPENSEFRKFLIPNSKEYFEIEIDEHAVIRIERKQ
ncbi:CBN-FBXA-178 protein [Caenorhabditis brenneri]|uniref:CBN-FBXA-178 protein n=1 Tax=Caenorhabditis brenneri TaxID=135651 RepID=G0PJ62_CAEBE|nr:CBN-FBXA-178 protein [Caenorhabditis brenneri]